MRRHRWPRDGDDLNRCADCGIRRQFKSAPPGLPLPVIVEYLVSGVGWTTRRPDCEIPLQKDLFERGDPEPAPVMRHSCHAIGCEVPVPPRFFMCRTHWYTLPERFREEIWRAYRPGQERDKRPSEAYLFAAREAITYIAQLERRPVPPPAPLPINVLPFRSGKAAQ